MRRGSLLGMVIVFLLTLGTARAQDTPVISEFMAVNTSDVPLSQGELIDADGQSSDWIELYNPTGVFLDLEGWYLTDNAEDLTKWELPAVQVAPRGYLVVFASGKDGGGPGQELHANFKLSSGGEFLALVAPDGETIVHHYDTYPQQFAGLSYGQMGDSVANVTQMVLVPPQAEAKALVPTDGSLGLDWTNVEFDDRAWITGRTGVGYDYAGLVNLDVAAMRSVNPSVYARIEFDVTDPSSIDGLVLKMRFEDGFVAFLNGQAVAGANAPGLEDLAFDSLATTNHLDEYAVEAEEFDLSSFKDALQAGRNVLAIQGLNVTLSSSDLLVLPELVGTQIQTIEADEQAEGYFVNPTPGGVNGAALALVGPAVSEVTHSPSEPTEDEDLLVTARVEPRGFPVLQVRLTTRVNYWPENAFTSGESLVMRDDGAESDATAGDGVYSAVIPSEFFFAGNMIRWSIAAVDAGGGIADAPQFLVPDNSPEYFGTVVRDPNLVSDLPILRWFTESIGRANSRAGTRASVFYDGEFYDNIFVRKRGGYTARNSQKFVFNNGFKFRISDEYDRVKEFNLNENGSDETYLRQPLAFETMRNAGCPASLSFLTLSVVNGDVDRVGIFIEQVDEEFLERNGYTTDGALYKFVQRGAITPVFNDISTGIEKKTREHEGLADMAAVVEGLNAATEDERRVFVFDNFNLPQMMNYLGARCLLQDTDDIRKNFYFYRDTNGSGEWSIFPWDKDWTFGVTGDGWIYTTHPFLGADSHPKNNARQWSTYLSVMYHLPETQEMFLRRLRTVMDQLLQPAGMPADLALFENRIDELHAALQPHLSDEKTRQHELDAIARRVNSLKNYFPPRRVQLYVNHSIHNTTNPPVGGVAGIPDSQPTDATIQFGRFDYNPESGNQDEEYVELVNTNDYAVDISGWRLTEGIRHTFAEGTVIIAGGSLYVSPEASAFRQRAVSPTGGEGNFVQGNYKGQLSNGGETITLEDSEGRVVAVLSYAGD